MPDIISSAFTSFKKIFCSKVVIGIVGILVIGTGGYFLSHHAPTYQFISVTQGPITESVSLTGNTTPNQSVSLTFGSNGTIARAYSDLGKQVHIGQVLAELNTSDLVAQLRQAQADVDTQQAKLQGLQAGSRPEDIATSQAALDKAKQDLANMYASIGDASLDSYTKANDAANTQLSQILASGDQGVSYSTSDSTSQATIELNQIATDTALRTWQTSLTNISQSTTGLQTLLQNEISYLTTVRTLLTNVSNALNNSISLSANTLATYKANVSTALNEVNTATKNLNTISQNIASQNLTITQLQAELDLKRAGSSPSDIAGAQAQVEAAQASVASAEAKLQNAEIIAPISGTVTQFDAKVGQQASANTPLVSIMSNGGYEVDAGASEIDVGKIALGDKVTMTLDAFPNETFTGAVFYIAPSETNTGGVINYQIKISFDKTDPRLKSGLTANIDIQTKQKDNVLILPQYAILQNDEGTYVETLENKKVVQHPVTLGIQDEKGNVEVVSGVTAGEEVLNIGLKAQ